MPFQTVLDSAKPFPLVRVMFAHHIRHCRRVGPQDEAKTWLHSDPFPRECGRVLWGFLRSKEVEPESPDTQDGWHPIEFTLRVVIAKSLSGTTLRVGGRFCDGGSVD